MAIFVSRSVTGKYPTIPTKPLETQNNNRSMPSSAEWEAAKPFLEKDYLEGSATDEMALQDVINLRPEIHGKVKRANFSNNWRSLKACKKKTNTTSTEKSTNKHTAWEIAKPLLEKDFLEGTATSSMTPQEVIDLRPGIYDKVPRDNFLTNW